MREEIKDSRNQRIGFIEKSISERSCVYDKSGSMIGALKRNGHCLDAYDRSGRKFAYYDENLDTTFETPSHRKLGKGNMLMDMFFKN